MTYNLVEPLFDSPLTDLIIDLNYLRKKRLGGTTPPPVFFNLKSIFHMLESIGSARIEGNNTSLLDYIETKLEDKTDVPIGVKEIQNIENAMDFIEKNMNPALKDGVHFINQDDSPKFDLLKTAIAHHRFVWIHPFGNGKL